MDLKKLDRSALKAYFVKNAVPTSGNFADLVDGMINQKEDGIAKPAGQPVSVQAEGDRAINFYKSFADSKPAWTLGLNPGFSIGDGDGASRLFIDPAGNVGIGTAATASYKLNVQGVVQAIHQNQDANGGCLMLGPANQSNLRLGYHADYSWIQSHGNKPLVINPLANNVGIGVTNPENKLQVAGNLHMVGNSIFFRGDDPKDQRDVVRWDRGDDRLHVGGWNGVVLGHTQDGANKVTPVATVDKNGSLTAKAVRVTNYTASVTKDQALSTANTWADFPQLVLTFTLAQEAEVAVFYGISMLCAAEAGHLCTKLIVDNAERPLTRSICGNVKYWACSSNWVTTLAAGSHTLKVQYRTPHGGTLSPGHDWQKGVLTVTVYGKD